VVGEQFEDAAKQRHVWKLGMWTFLGSELLLFAGLFALYGGYRAEHGFNVASRHDEVAIGTINTYVLVTSSLTVALAVGAVRGGRRGLAVLLLVISFAFGAVFLTLKGTEYWLHLQQGIAPGRWWSAKEIDGYGARTYFTLYYLMTGLHSIHVAAGMVVLAVLGVGVSRRRWHAENHLPVELGALYWHLVDLIWLFLWPMFYRGGG
jgi:cytochrome c oxidase subunit 3